MGWMRFEARAGLRSCVWGLSAAVAALTVTSDAADAWHHRRGHVRFAHHRGVRVHRHAEADRYSPPFASIVVDGNTGSVLQTSNPDALRHPASLTKIMTLYLLFERLEAGKMRLDTQIEVSEHAADQAPSKLGIKPGRTISVEDAIKAVVTRSANDIAVAIAESIGGSEDNFARLMTQRARALGMSRTTYVNASGLPDDDQITTARDQALLGRAIQDRFPQYYRYFSTATFVYRGEAIRNHNHLLGSVGGVDGIKTGYTRASGFNLVTSVHRDGRFIVAVVLGGHSASARDAHMRELISSHIREASLHHTAPVLAEAAQPHLDALPRAAVAKAPPPAPASLSQRADVAPTASVSARPKPGSTAPIQPVLVRTISYRTVPPPTGTLAPLPALVPVTAAPAVQAAPPLQSAHVYAEPAQVADASDTTAAATPRSEPQRAEPVAAEPARSEPEPARARAHGGWLIQIGAFDGEDEARQHLSVARLKAHAALAAADPFTERVQKGEKALYRARFAGFDRATAAATCRELRRSDIECMALKD